MPGSALTTGRLEYVTFSHPYDTVYLFISFRYSIREIQFEQRFRVLGSAVQFLH